MNSIDKSTMADELSRFFDEKILPLAETLSAQDKKYFSTHGTDTAESYYIRRKSQPPSREDFEIVDFDSQEGLELKLVALWQSQGAHELIELAPEIARLSMSLQKQSDSDEISPFIYVMF